MSSVDPSKSDKESKAVWRAALLLVMVLLIVVALLAIFDQDIQQATEKTANLRKEDPFVGLPGWGW